MFQGDFREENFQKAMAVIKDGGNDPGSRKGRRGGTKGELFKKEDIVDVRGLPSEIEVKCTSASIYIESELVS